MGIPDRLFNLAKSYLDSARSRWDEVDTSAQKELDAAVESPALAAWERAQAKINAATSTNQAQKELKSSQSAVPTPPPLSDTSAPPPSPNAVAAAYKVLDLQPGSDLLSVQKAYQDLKEKADPARFVTGSSEEKLATDIQRRINAAYMVLANALSSPSDDRFDRLEL